MSPGQTCSQSNLAQVPVSTTDWQLSPLQACPELQTVHYHKISLFMEQHQKGNAVEPLAHFAIQTWLTWLPFLCGSSWSCPWMLECPRRSMLTPGGLTSALQSQQPGGLAKSPILLAKKDHAAKWPEALYECLFKEHEACPVEKKSDRHLWVAEGKDLISLSNSDQQMKIMVRFLTAQSWFSNRPVKPQSLTPRVLCQVLYKARTIQSQLPGAHDICECPSGLVLGSSWHAQASSDMLLSQRFSHQTLVSHLSLEVPPQDLLFPHSVFLVFLRLDPFLLLSKKGWDVLVKSHHSLIIQLFITLIFFLLFLEEKTQHINSYSSEGCGEGCS